MSQPTNPEEIAEFGGPVWRCGWNHYGTMLAVSYTNSNGRNMVQIVKENEEGKWEPGHKIDA